MSTKLKTNSVVFLVVATSVLSGCTRPYDLTYTPTGLISYKDLTAFPVTLNVSDGRKESEKFFFKHTLGVKYWDIDANKFQRQSFSPERPSYETLKNALEEAMTYHGYKLTTDAPIQIDVSLYKYRHVCDWAAAWQGRVFADMEFDVSVRKKDYLLVRKRISSHSAKLANSFRQFEDGGLLLSGCLTKGVEKFVSDPEIIGAIKRGYGVERPVKTAERKPTKEIDKSAKQGTGFLLTEGGLVVTNYHVVSGREEIRVFLPEVNREFEARVELKDIANDLAVLRLKAFTYDKVFAREIPFAISESNTVRLGQEVFTLGFPFGKLLGESVKFSNGTVSSLSGLMGTANLFQINNPIQPGNSGSPLFDRHGHVIGIVLASLDAGFVYENLDTIPQNVNFAIKSDYLINLISMLPESGSILSRKGSLQDKTQEEQVNAIVPYIVTIYAGK